MEIVGKIKKIMDVQNVSDKFKKREFVLSTDLNTPYPQHILFQTTQEKCSMLDNLKVTDEVKVFFNIRGREWTNQEGQIKYFVTLEAWRIDKFTPVESASSSATSNNYASNTNTSSSPSSASNVSNEITTAGTDIQTADDDLPF